MSENAALYHRLRYVFFFLNLGTTLAFITIGYSSGIFVLFEKHVATYAFSPVIHIALVVICFHLALDLILFPLAWCQHHLMERRFNLSNESFSQWLVDHAKSLVLSSILALAGAEIFFAVLKAGGEHWWIWAASLWLAGTCFLAWVIPLWIIPLFYPTTPLEEGALHDRIYALLKRLHLKVNGVYRLNLSRKTKKANAAVVGLGPSKRIVLGDTLIKSFTPEEVEVVVCHELGHYVKRHILQGLFFNLCLVMSVLLLLYLFGELVIAYFSVAGLADPVLYPFYILGVAVSGFALMPIQNAYSRLRERQADEFALNVTRAKNVFISTMNKLASQNLAVLKPNTILEFWFYSHPSIRRRIQFAEDYHI